MTTRSANDNDIEFTVDANNNPIQPRDPRYQFITSQPYASSYGFLQLSLIPFDSTNKGLRLTQAFNPSTRPIYQLMTQPATTFDLAGHFHQLSFAAVYPNSPPCTTNSCNEVLWEQEWTSVFLSYNPQGAGYADGKIIEDGASKYAPQEPQ